MASIRTKYYTMPKGPDGKRHRVWHEMSGLTMMDMAAKHDNLEAVALVIGILSRDNPILEGMVCNE
jgi:hypothetical protein